MIGIVGITEATGIESRTPASINNNCIAVDS